MYGLWGGGGGLRVRSRPLFTVDEALVPWFSWMRSAVSRSRWSQTKRRRCDEIAVPQVIDPGGTLAVYDRENGFGGRWR